MKHGTFDSVSESEIAAFIEGSATVVRFFNPKTKWFVGKGLSVAINTMDTCKIRMQRYAAVDRKDGTTADPTDPGTSLMAETDVRSGPMLETTQPFIVAHPQKLVYESYDSPWILILVGDDGKVAILSRRPEDVRMIERMLGQRY